MPVDDFKTSLIFRRRVAEHVEEVKWRFGKFRANQNVSLTKNSGNGGRSGLEGEDHGGQNRRHRGGIDVGKRASLINPAAPPFPGGADSF